MTALRRQILLKAAKLYDLAVMVFSFAVATVLVSYETPTVSFADFLSMRVKVQNFVLFVGFLFLWHVIFSLFGLYDSRRLSARRAEVIDVLKATSLGTLVISLAAILFHIRMMTPPFVITFWAASTFIAVSSRLAARYLLARARVRGRNLRYMLMVGTNPRAVRFAQNIEAKPELGYRLVGFVDQEWPGIGEFRRSSYPLVSDFENFPGFLRNRVVDEVVIGLPMKSCYFQASRIAGLCEEQGIITRLLSNVFNLRLARANAEQFEEESVITLRPGSPENWQHLVKRLLDVSISLVALLVLAPLLLVTALLIKLGSPGPVFFVQERVGLNKRRFRLFKFRSMVADAEQRFCEVEHLNEVSGPVFKIKADPRLTRLGKLLRKTSIDELPQLFNVLKGDMSLVGPRPLPVRDYEGFDQDWQRRRCSVRPGITCLWQVDGRSSIPFEKWMELDMLYIDHWSLWLDVKILAKTIPAVLKGAGAN